MTQASIRQDKTQGCIVQSMNIARANVFFQASSRYVKAKKTLQRHSFLIIKNPFQKVT